MNSEEESYTPSSKDEEEFLPIVPKKRAASKSLKTAELKSLKTAASKSLKMVASKASKMEASKTSKTEASKASKALKRAGCSKKRGSGADKDESKDNCVKDLIVIKAVAKQEDVKLVTSEDKVIILKRFVDKFMEDYVDLQQGQTLDEAREVMTIW